MRRIAPICVVVAVALSGCVVRYSSRADSTGGNATSPVGVSSGSPLGNAIIIGVMAADAAHYYRLGPDGKTAVRAPEPDPTRRINVQDCTRPVDPYAGNLLCR
ncbi:MAG TPA: hypothetical protein VEM38_06625 [Burkholderiales bacterium]|nr:hypothetical protein [Burkholderiales bacterium]